MTTIIDKLKTEPALVASTVLAFLAYFGVRLSEDQVSTISQLVTVLGPLLAGLVIRSQVTPAAKANQPIPGLVYAVDANAPHGENPELVDEDDER